MLKIVCELTEDEIDKICEAHDAGCNEFLNRCPLYAKDGYDDFHCKISRELIKSEYGQEEIDFKELD